MRFEIRRWAWAALAAVLVGGPAWLAAAPVNPEAFKAQYDEAKKGAEVVAQVRVLSATCTAAEGGKSGEVTLQLALQVLEVEKGPVAKNDVLLVSHKVARRAGPGPVGAYAWLAATRRFPFTPGVRGSAALRWDAGARRYAVVTGWVPEPNGAAIPSEVGKTTVASDAPPPR